MTLDSVSYFDIDVLYDTESHGNCISLKVYKTRIGMTLGEAQALYECLGQCLRTAYSHLSLDQCTCGVTPLFGYEGDCTYVQCPKCRKRTDAHLKPVTSCEEWNAMNGRC